MREDIVIKTLLSMLNPQMPISHKIVTVQSLEKVWIQTVEKLDPDSDVFGEVCENFYGTLIHEAKEVNSRINAAEDSGYQPGEADVLPMYWMALLKTIACYGKTRKERQELLKALENTELAKEIKVGIVDVLGEIGGPQGKNPSIVTALNKLLETETDQEVIKHIIAAIGNCYRK